jgi:hypothetical protein
MASARKEPAKLRTAVPRLLRSRGDVQGLVRLGSKGLLDLTCTLLKRCGLVTEKVPTESLSIRTPPSQHALDRAGLRTPWGACPSTTHGLLDALRAAGRAYTGLLTPARDTRHRNPKSCTHVRLGARQEARAARPGCRRWRNSRARFSATSWGGSRLSRAFPYCFPYARASEVIPK